MSRKTLLLFTISYPYVKAGEHTFINPELIHLKSAFKKIIIIPQSVGGEKEPVAGGIIVDETLAKYLERDDSFFIKLIKGIDIKLLFGELLRKPTLFFQPAKLICLLLFIHSIKRMRGWFLRSNYYHIEDNLLYTYWFTSITSCLVLYSKDPAKIITRTHGSDLYEERHNGYIPLRQITLKNIKAIYFASLAGANYLKQKYPEFSYKYELARLGTKMPSEKPTFRKKEANIFRIVSCSSIIPLKRVDLILRAVIQFADFVKDKKVEYIHFGDGPLKNELERIAESNKNKNLSISLKGQVRNENIINYYQNTFIDAFMNASTTEGGGPVAMQEAQSFGIPCIGTNVGGIPEIINKNNGILLSANPDKMEIAGALLKMYEMNDDDIIALRRNSYENWRKNFNADINFKKFAEEIATL